MLKSSPDSIAYTDVFVIVGLYQTKHNISIMATYMVGTVEYKGWKVQHLQQLGSSWVVQLAAAA